MHALTDDSSARRYCLERAPRYNASESVTNKTNEDYSAITDISQQIRGIQEIALDNQFSRDYTRSLQNSESGNSDYGVWQGCSWLLSDNIRMCKTVVHEDIEGVFVVDVRTAKNKRDLESVVHSLVLYDDDLLIHIGMCWVGYKWIVETLLVLSQGSLQLYLKWTFSLRIDIRLWVNWCVGVDSRHVSWWCTGHVMIVVYIRLYGSGDLDMLIVECRSDEIDHAILDMCRGSTGYIVDDSGHNGTEICRWTHWRLAVLVQWTYRRFVCRRCECLGMNVEMVRGRVTTRDSGGVYRWSSNTKNSQVVLKVPRRNNLYCFNLSDIQPERDVTYLLAKASLGESTKWYKRMAHVNFKNMNKLAKHGLVNGLPSKLFTNEHNCVACNKGKQHKLVVYKPSLAGEQPFLLLSSYFTWTFLVLLPSEALITSTTPWKKGYWDKWILKNKRDAKGIVVRNKASQDKYVQDMLKKFDIESVRPATTPFEASKPKSKDEPDNAVNVHLYRSMIGSLMYLTALRPDIHYSDACSRHLVTPFDF
ncbi:putative ribonuclease H-like domain-containing protein [Tanacetum coccineum]